MVLNEVQRSNFKDALAREIYRAFPVSRGYQHQYAEVMCQTLWPLIDSYMSGLVPASSPERLAANQAADDEVDRRLVEHQQRQSTQP